MRPLLQKLTCWAHALIASLLPGADAENDNQYGEKKKVKIMSRTVFPWIWYERPVVTILPPSSCITNPRAHLSPHGNAAADLADEDQRTPPNLPPVKLSVQPRVPRQRQKKREREKRRDGLMSYRVRFGSRKKELPSRVLVGRCFDGLSAKTEEPDRRTTMHGFAVYSYAVRSRYFLFICDGR